MAKINSYETKKFVVGKEYWTYYVDLTNAGNRLKDYTGLMRVRLDAIDKSSYDKDGYKRFTILESKKLGRTIAHNVHGYFHGYGIASCDFYDTKEECIVGHDKHIVQLSKGQTVNDRNAILEKLIKKVEVSKPKIETESIAWYKGLSKKEKSYVEWIKESWDLDEEEKIPKGKKESVVII